MTGRVQRLEVYPDSASGNFPPNRGPLNIDPKNTNLFHQKKRLPFLIHIYLHVYSGPYLILRRGFIVDENYYMGVCIYDRGLLKSNLLKTAYHSLT